MVVCENTVRANKNTVCAVKLTEYDDFVHTLGI